jgi:signal transduction histidine kinase
LRILVFLFVVAISVFFHGCRNQSRKVSSGYSFFQWGEYLYYYEKTDSAFLMFSRAVNSTTDNIEKSKAYSYMGTMQQEAGDLYGAQESLTAALQTLDVNNEKHRDLIASLYNTLGNTSLDLKKYNEAIGFYDAALAVAKEKNYILEMLNGKATALQKEGNYADAIAIYDSILHLQPADKSLTARAISNRARTKWLQDPNYPALEEYRSALKIRIDSQYNRGLNASYAHLSDYYSRVQSDSALFYAQKMHQKAKEIENPDDMLEAVDKLIRLNSSTASKQYWYEEFKKLNDSIQMARDTAKNQFALIRYDVQKSKTDNLILQQHINRQRLLIAGVAVLATIVIIALSLWYGRRRRRLKLESENAIRESQLKTSQKVHDVVANGLYIIMNELEHLDTLDKEPLLNKIEGLYEKSRNISYEDLPRKSADQDKEIHQLLISFANEHTKVIVVGNQQIFWTKITAFQKNELQLVLNEIMINMQKHSNAKNVVVQFKQENNTGFIKYKDDGKGFKDGAKFGNGLNNTVSRIRSLNGQVNFEKSGGQGVSIEISFPLEST